MPRAAWLAVGSFAIAFAGTSVDPGPALVSALGAVVCGLYMVGTGVRRRRTRIWATGLGLLTVGTRLAVACILASQSPAAGPPPLEARAWVGHVERVGSTDGDMQRALLTVRLPADAPADTAPARSSPASSAIVPAEGPWVVYAWLPRYPIVAPGDSIAFTAALELPPEGPGFGDVVRQQGAVASVRLRSMQLLPDDGDALALLESGRRWAGELIARALPEPEAGLASGILIGLRDLVDRDLAADFTTAGLSHVVAISGWNIAVVGAVIVGMLRRFPRRRRSLAVLAAIFVYTLLAGASPSVVRAAVMGAVVLVARESGRQGSAATALGLAVWILLLIDPRMAQDVGFQLSVAATGGLLAWGSTLQARLAAHAPRLVPGWLVETGAVSLAAQASTLPLILLHFGRVSLVSPLSNLVAAPIVAPAMLASLLGLLCGLATSLGAPQLLVMPGVLGGWIGLAALVTVAQVSASLPLASVSLPPPVDALAALVVALTVGVFGTAVGRRLRSAMRRAWPASGNQARIAGRGPPGTARGPGSGRAIARAHGSEARRNGRAAGSSGGNAGSGHRETRLARRLATLAAVLVITAAAVAAARPDGRLRLTVLDVGQGDAILLEGPRGSRMLVDTGPDPNLLLRRLDERIPAWDRRLDLVVLTHPHEDHVSGMAFLMSRYRIATIGENGMLGAGPGDQAYRLALPPSAITPIVLAAGHTLHLDGATIEVLWPAPGTVPRNSPDSGAAVNDASIVLDVRYGQRRMLLTGDIQEEVDASLLNSGAVSGQPRVDVLKVAHHGSRTATSKAFLAAIHPAIAIISVGTGNTYGHPSSATLERLAATGAATYRTDLDGTVSVSTDGRDLVVAPAAPRAASPSSATSSSIFGRGVPIATIACARGSGAGTPACLAAPTYSPADTTIDRLGSDRSPAAGLIGASRGPPGVRTDSRRPGGPRHRTDGVSLRAAGDRPCRRAGPRRLPCAPECRHGRARTHPARRNGRLPPAEGCLATIAPMTVPSREAACRLLLDLHPSPRLLRHMTVVAEIAAFLAERAAALGVPIDRHLVEAAALLHDVDKALPPDHPLQPLGHGDAGARWLTDSGFGELAAAVASHPVSTLADEDHYAAFLAGADRETRFVAYADKRATQRLQSMDRRFARWERRHPDYAESLSRARRRATELERQVCADAGVDPQDVRRLRWVGPAMVRAAEDGPSPLTAGADLPATATAS